MLFIQLMLAFCYYKYTNPEALSFLFCDIILKGMILFHEALLMVI